VGRKPEFKAVSLRTETAYKADAPGKVAQHTDAQGSGAEVNVEVAQRKFAFLSGETSTPCVPATGSGESGNRSVEGGGVSRRMALEEMVQAHRDGLRVAVDCERPLD